MFIVGTDNDDNELLALEVIHRFVQGLDGAFGNVSELDILYGMEKVSLEASAVHQTCSPTSRHQI